MESMTTIYKGKDFCCEDLQGELSSRWTVEKIHFLPTHGSGTSATDQAIEVIHNTVLEFASTLHSTIFFG
jgi:hypothetical protein